MKQNKQVSVSPELINSVMNETDNFSKALDEALRDWLRARHAGGDSEKELVNALARAEKQANIVREMLVKTRASGDIKLWYDSQTPEMRGTIGVVAEREMRNFLEVAKDYRDGRLKAMV